jgi:hypothetical protein
MLNFASNLQVLLWLLHSELCYDSVSEIYGTALVYTQGIINILSCFVGGSSYDRFTI